MKEQKTLNDLISYYEREVNRLDDYKNTIDDIYLSKSVSTEFDLKINFLSQLKQLKEDNPYQKMWGYLKLKNNLYKTDLIIEEAEKEYLGVDKQ